MLCSIELDWDLNSGPKVLVYYCERLCCNKKDICVTELIYPMHGMWMLQRSIFKRNIYKCTKRELEVVNKR